MDGAGTAGADGPDFPARHAPRCSGLGELDALVTQCRACPRLVAWREETAETKRAAFRDWDYWARPVPGFGPADATVAVVGLAPAAHGGNRTGRMFTGDATGDFLFVALHSLGLASQPTSLHAEDGLTLRGVRLTSPVHCAPPANKPTPGERDTCRPWLAAELELLSPGLRAVVVLGGFGWQAVLPVLVEAGWQLPRPVRPSATGRMSCCPPRSAGRNCTCWAATTRASATRSRAGSPCRCSSTCSGRPRPSADSWPRDGLPLGRPAVRNGW